jgi:monofunctional biosynthetic peptidoglycan transglycosylase
MARRAAPKAPPKSKTKAPPGKPKATSGRGPSRWRWALAGLSLVALAAVAHALLPLPSEDEVAALAHHRPKTTALIEARAEEAREAQQHPRRVQTWVPISDVAPELIASVLASEDARFFLHEGVDVAQLKEALKKDLRTGHFARGASTLTQQLAKNLWLSERKSLLRKLQEVVLAHRLEDALTKERILELYLNEVEWGDGLYGCEAAARTYFGKPCRDLSLAEAAQLAATLPAPRQLVPGSGSEAVLARTRHVLQRVEDEHLATAASVARARTELERTRGRGGETSIQQL